MNEFEFWTTTEEFGRDADQSALLNRVTDRKSIGYRVVGVILVLTTLFFAIITLEMLLQGNWDMGLLFGLMLATLAAMLAWMWSPWSVVSEVKAGRKERKKNGVFDKQVTIFLNEKGGAVALEQGAPRPLFTWEDIGKIAESENLFFLAGKKIPGICLNKNALREGSVDQLRAFLQTKYSKPIQAYEINTEKLQKLLK